MRNLSVLVGLLILLVACSSPKKYSHEVGGFEIGFTAEPVISIDTFQTELGSVVSYSFMEEISKTNARMLSFSEYPINQKYIADPYKFIEGAKDAALNSLGVDNLSIDKRITVGEYPGLEVAGTNKQNLYIHYKLFLKGTVLYQIGLLKEGNAVESEDELLFMESFVFL